MAYIIAHKQHNDFTNVLNEINQMQNEYTISLKTDE